MPLESCMLVLDNSEYMRNGDYMPNRFQAQAQAVSTVFTAKTDSNPESAVGLMTMAGKSPSLLVTPTNDIGKLLTAMSKSTIGGLSDLQTSVQIAQLALKHRENKNQRQRIVVFVGSPLADSAESLVKLGKKLRKNNVLVDVVVFGEEGLGEEEKLGALIEAAGGGESHLVAIPPGPHLLSDMIRQSPILGEEGGHGGGEGGDESMGMDDLDPNMDPELAMAIRMSLQEAQEASARQAASAGGEAGPSSSSQPVPPSSASDVFSAGPSSALPPSETATGLPAGLTAPLTNAFTREPPAPGDGTPTPAAHGAASGMDEGEDDDEEAMLARAMALSRGEHGDVEMEGGDEDEEDEEAAIARAIQMSLEEPKGGDKKP